PGDPAGRRVHRARASRAADDRGRSRRGRTVVEPASTDRRARRCAHPRELVHRSRSSADRSGGRGRRRLRRAPHRRIRRGAGSLSSASGARAAALGHAPGARARARRQRRARPAARQREAGRRDPRHRRAQHRPLDHRARRADRHGSGGARDARRARSRAQVRLSRAQRRPVALGAPLGERGRVLAVTSDGMRGLDGLTIERGTPGETLMERAGLAAVEVLQQRFSRALRRGVVVVAGKGNNGGDGLVIARHLRRRRVPVRVFLAAAADGLAGDAKTNLLRWKRLRGPLHEIDRGTERLAEATSRAGVIVDALFGTGLHGELDERARAIVETMNGDGRPILAVDVPSGLDADKGVALGAAVQANVTVTFGYPKLGLLLYPGAELAGEVVVADIGIDPAALAEVSPRERLLTEEVVARA